MVGGKPACTVPPEGWYCTREKGHDPPCAALPATQEFLAAAAVDGHPTQLPTSGWELVGYLLRERSSLLANTAAAQNRGTECINKLRAGRALVRTYVVAVREIERFVDPGDNYCDVRKGLTDKANEAYLALEAWLAENP